jgi:tripartite-type tricarboxylate transporter receptor subunit TctC
MFLTPRRTAITVLAALPLMLCGQSATAQGNALRIIVPASAGSGQDVMVRTVQNAMSKTLKRAVVVENIPGSGGLIGTQQLVKASPDGNTIAFVSNNHAVNPAVYPKMPYDSLRDITPIAVVAETPFLLVVNPKNLPVSNAKEMVALLKSRPSQYNFGSSGNGPSCTWRRKCLWMQPM